MDHCFLWTADSIQVRSSTCLSILKMKYLLTCSSKQASKGRSIQNPLHNSWHKFMVVTCNYLFDGEPCVWRFHNRPIHSNQQSQYLDVASNAYLAVIYCWYQLCASNIFDLKSAWLFFSHDYPSMLFILKYHHFLLAPSFIQVLVVNTWIEANVGVNGRPTIQTPNLLSFAMSTYIFH